MTLRLDQRAGHAATGPVRPALWALAVTLCTTWASATQLGDGAAVFHTRIEPILQQYCFDCHGDGMNKGKVAFDQFASDQVMLEDHELWLKALRNLRAGLMPPPRKPQPSPEQKQTIQEWIKAAVFKADLQNPDPGRITVRRLNRVEYRNTIRDLMGIDFDTEKEFPPDDAGYGFDNIGDVLTLPPMLLEKYLAAARTMVARAVPSASAAPAERIISGRRFLGPAEGKPSHRSTGEALVLSYYEPVSVTNTLKAELAGKYQLLLDFTGTERFVDNVFDYNKCRLTFRCDGHELFQHDYTRETGKAFHYEFDQDWPAGEHELVVQIEPLTPDEKQVRSLTLRLDSVTVRGPLDRTAWVKPKGYDRFFPTSPPESGSARRAYARDLLSSFVSKAYRRPADSNTVTRLVDLAEASYTQPGQTFESGIGQAMMAVLASPRFLFREEGIEVPASGSSAPCRYPLVDEYALASRLSYFLWSSMPDRELFDLARQHQLRRHLPEQIRRMLADRKSEALVHNFVGQWLQVRDIETVQIDARQVLQREAAPDPDQERRRQRARELREKEETTPLTSEEKKELDELRTLLFRRPNRPGRAELNGELRRAMRQETEKTFEYVLRQDRSLLELLDSGYTFLNERLATHYGLTNLNVKGEEMRLVHLPPESPRGGVLTQGAILAVTSNPTRTSPVKRGLFVLDNLLGTPPAPPPPDIPVLEDAAKSSKGKKLTLRQTLALHRQQALCSSCHNRMDPLGLALDHFNALGMWRDQEQGQPIDATGTLLSGESFATVQELKHLLVRNHALEFYRTVTEKLLTYALGRGLEYYDVATVDQIVNRLLEANGRPTALIAGIIESAPFQKTRVLAPMEPSPAEPATQRAEAKTSL